MKVIDFHAHVFPDALAGKVVATLENYYQMSWSRTGTISDIKDSMEEGEVEKSVVFSTPTKPEQVTKVNDFLFSLKDDPMFVCFGSVHPDYEDCAGEIKRIKSRGLKGFKFHPDFQHFNVDDEKMLKIYDEIGSDYPILIHAGDKNNDFSSPSRFAHLLELFPKHKFIAAHLGGYSEWDKSYKYLVGKNIYFDTSSSMCCLTAEETEELIKAHGTDKILFGTDYPAISHKQELDKFLKLNFTDNQFEAMLYNNAKKLLGI